MNSRLLKVDVQPNQTVVSVTKLGKKRVPSNLKARAMRLKKGIRKGVDNNVDPC